jgi:signal transduction histidine kinase
MAAPLERMNARREDKVNILLVDDQPARLLSYESILSSLDQNLVMAHSGAEALERVMAQEFAVVLLDVNMPGMDGFETAALIHEHPRYEKTPIIFITGVHVSELDRLLGYKVGAVDYVAIPVVPEILRSKVAVLVELYCQRRELRKLNRSLEEANARLAQAHSTLQVEKTRELEELNSTLREANRHKDEFLAMLAHELRNPLAPILNAVQLMRNPQLPAPQLTWAREVIERQLGHLTKLVDDLLDVSRITRGKINVSRKPVELAAVIARAVETVEPMLSRQRHELIVSVEPEPLYIDGDLTRLTQIVGNILSNAVKYTDAGGRIELTAGAIGEWIEIRVLDNGIGIDPAVLPEVFDLFTQSSQLNGRGQTGLGIGLALAKRLVQMHGGEVRAHSDGPGKGSVFTVLLPRQTGASAAAAAVAAGLAEGVEPAALSAIVTRRILVADDNSDALESLAQLLELGGHEIHKAADGVQALEAATRVRPDLVLLDIGMPGMDGYEVARRIRSQPWGREATLVALTGWGQESDRKRSREAGFDSHCIKPLDLQHLFTLLDSLPAPGRSGVEPAARMGE